MDSFPLSRKQLFLIITLLFLLLVIPLTIYLVNQTQIFKPKADLSDSCTTDLTDGQTITGTNFQFTTTATKSNPLAYLSVWALNSKLGDYQITSSNKVESFVQTINTSALFNNGSATIECRLQTTEQGGTTIASKSVQVQVSNNPADAVDFTYSQYGCTISGPSVMTPGQTATFRQETTSLPAAVADWRWVSYVSNPYLTFSKTDNSLTWTAPTYTGYFPKAIALTLDGGPFDPNSGYTQHATCQKDIIVSTDGSSTIPRPGTYWTYCSNEGSDSPLGAKCTFSGTATVRYGREPVWFTKTNVTGSIGCNSTTFGYNIPESQDPNAQKNKHCEYMYEGANTPTNSPLPSISTVPSPSPSAIAAASTRPGGGVCNQSNGDANADGRANGLDFSVWSSEFLSNIVSKADFNCDGKVSGLDFSIWSNAFLSQF